MPPVTEETTLPSDLDSLIGEARRLLTDGDQTDRTQALERLVARLAAHVPKPKVDATRFRPDRAFRDQIEDAEREIILSALQFTRDNATEAARMLDLERGHFYKKMKSLGLKRAGGETFTSRVEFPAPRPSA